MTDTNTAPSASSKAPSHVAYQVRDREGKKGFWTRIGSAWPHADGKGFNIQIEAVPLDGRITLRIFSEKKDEHATQPGGRQPAHNSKETTHDQEIQVQEQTVPRHE